MERLLLLRLESSGVAAEAALNGVPLVRVGPSQRVAMLPVHEYTLAGDNELQLVLQPAAAGVAEAPPEPLLSDGATWARATLLLPRVGSPADPDSARTLARLDIAPELDTVLMTPHAQTLRAALPIAFPRWRWVDAPVLPDAGPAHPGHGALKAALAAWLLDIAVGLARGNPEPLVQATRLRLEDLSLAYQRPLPDEVGRLRAHLQQLHAEGPLQLVLPTAAALSPRPVAGGRLLECLAADGQPALRARTPDGAVWHWPLRVARVEGRFYGLR